MDRKIESESKYVIFDVGYSSTTAYLIKVTPETGKEKEKSKIESTKLSIVDYESAFVGGKDVDEEIFKDIKLKFDDQNKTDLDLNEGRVFKILLNEIDKFKNKLSANKKNKL